MGSSVDGSVGSVSDCGGQYASGILTIITALRLREEIEQSKYVFGQVDLEGADFGAFHRDLFDKYYQLARALLDARLVWPALEHTLKCSHLFNILDSSNSIGVTERTAYILRVRQLAVGIARHYVDEPAGKAVA